jgi:conjugative relaxase-like TrwC/TraI family protein
VTVSMRVMSAGDGFRYLLKTVAAGDGNRDLGTPLTRYYQEKGTPPGFWLGTGVNGLGGGSLDPGDEVTETHLQLLLGLGCDPVTGEPLGKAWPTYRTTSERIDARIEQLPSGMTIPNRAEAILQIEQDEKTQERRRAVAGFDYTFSVPKSVSTLWAVADGATQARIVAAHHAAIAEVIDLMERDVAMTRIGADAGDGSVAQVEVRGVVATAYDHYDSRASDPQLHTHVVIANKVQAVIDGKWRTLDGRPMHAAVVALSEHYNAVLADHLARDLGVEWEMRQRGNGRNPHLEIVGVTEELMGEFSSRSHHINIATDQLITDYLEKHGRRPSPAIILKLRAEATLSTRPDKTVHSLAELTTEWRTRADRVLGGNSVLWADGLIARGSIRDPASHLSVENFTLDRLQSIGTEVVRVVGEKRSTWRRWNLHAETSRQLMDVRFTSTADREAILGVIVDAAEQQSIRLTPPKNAFTPEVLQRPDGSSVFRPKHGTVFTSAALVTAEDRLLELASSATAPTVGSTSAPRPAQKHHPNGRSLSADQATALQQIQSSGRTVDILLGPAGTGKTTTLAALRASWEREYGAGSVIGVAPSAAAAQILGDELGIRTENTAKWIHAHAHNDWNMKPGQLMIVDEASLAGTLTLNTLAEHAAQTNAKLLLVGDWAQLSAVESGGAFGLLARTIDNVPELSEVRRFHAEWEKTASLALRTGDTAVIATYEHNDRVRGGDLDEMLDAAYTAWRNDLAAGKKTVMIAETVDTVTALNERARLDRIISGQVNPTGAVALHDGTEASSGDLVISRKNDRRLNAGKSWVKNNDRWIITATNANGTVTARRAGQHGGAPIDLPASYVAENLELGYAVTAHRAQGSTVDTAHAVVHSNQVTRETFYVAMTRGRESNIAYVATDQAHLESHHHTPDAEVTAGHVLAGVLKHIGAEPSAHEMIAIEQSRWEGIGQLAAEYDTVATTAQHDRWVALLRRSGLSSAQTDAVLASESFGPLTMELRRADAYNYSPETLLPRLVAARSLEDSADIGAVLRYRVRHATAERTGSTGRRAPHLVVGLIPEARGPMSVEMRQALDERATLIRTRTATLAMTALRSNTPWTKSLGISPDDARRRTAWFAQVQVIAAYRDRYTITDSAPLGRDETAASGASAERSEVHRSDARQARIALARARKLGAEDPAQFAGPTVAVPNRAAPRL